MTKLEPRIQPQVQPSNPIQKRARKLKQFFSDTLGPGFVTGAADDDPSGVATFSQAGAQFGPNLMWLPLFVFPLMVCIQEMSARIGLVTHRGIIRILKEDFPPYVLWVVGLITVPAVMINVGADLLAMGAVANMLIPSVPTAVFSSNYVVHSAPCSVLVVQGRDRSR